MKVTERRTADGFITISRMIEEMERDLPANAVPAPPERAVSGKKAILDVLGRAADDHKFLARLAEDPAKVLQEYDLSLEERAALASGDICRIESWVGKLDQRLGTWLWCRLQQEKW